MQTRIEEHPDYESKIDDDPIALLEAIKTLMHDPVRAQYPYASLVSQLTAWLNMRQQPDEGLMDYVKRFKHARDNAKSFLGPTFLDDFVKTTKAYREEPDSDKQTDMLLKSSVPTYCSRIRTC